MVQLVKNNLAAVREHVSGQATLQSRLCDTQESSSWCEAGRKSVREETKAPERHLSQVAQKPNVVQARLMQEMFRSRAFESELFNFQDAVSG